MNSTAKREFNKLSTKEKRDYIQDLLDRNAHLEEHEFEAASKEQKREAIQLKIDRANWLETYEFKEASNLQMEKYILRKRFLTPEEFNSLPDGLKKFYLEQGSYTQITVDDEEFEQLSKDFKKFYVNFAFEYPLKFSITPKMAPYLSDSQQKKWVDFLFEKGISLSNKELSFLKKPIRDYYKQKKEELFEVRKVVNRIISENLFSK
jgi:hypothetical protein